MKRCLAFALALGAVGAFIHVWILTRIYGWNVPHQLLFLGLIFGAQYAIGFFCWYSFVSRTKQGLIKKALPAVSVGLLVCVVIGAMMLIAFPWIMVLSILPQNLVMLSGMASGFPLEGHEEGTASK